MAIRCKITKSGNSHNEQYKVEGVTLDQYGQDILGQVDAINVSPYARHQIKKYGVGYGNISTTDIY